MLQTLVQNLRLIEKRLRKRLRKPRSSAENGKKINLDGFVDNQKHGKIKHFSLPNHSLKSNHEGVL